MAKIAAPSAKKALADATRCWPRRSRASDGIIPSKAHTRANPNSDHEPGRAGFCHAFDLTHDPKNGCNCSKISEAMRLEARGGDSRYKYIIYSGRICSAIDNWAWRSYSGSNSHTKHMHVSLNDTRFACTSKRAWAGICGGATVAQNKEAWWVDAIVDRAQYADKVLWWCKQMGLKLIGRGGDYNEELTSVHIGSKKKLDQHLGNLANIGSTNVIYPKKGDVMVYKNDGNNKVWRRWLRSLLKL